MHQCCKKYNHRNACWQLYSDASSSTSAMWSEPETCALTYWKENSMEREDEAGWGEDGQMTSRTGQTEQWQSVDGWRGTDNNGDCWYMKRSPTLSSEEGRKQEASKLVQSHECLRLEQVDVRKLTSNCAQCTHMSSPYSWTTSLLALVVV